MNKKILFGTTVAITVVAIFPSSGFFMVSSDGQQRIGGAPPFTVFQQILDATI
ncbi:MAG: hypothetical protein KC444_04370 [Nitrosopumilus sp.]|nr:hypothetical protein [Nitrosopumilus sp.]